MQDRLTGLRTHSAEKHKSALSKIEKALCEMEHANEVITFNSVAQRAGVARSTLYCNPQIAQHIREVQSHKEDTEKVPGPSEKIPDDVTVLLETLGKQKAQISKMTATIRQLREDKKNLEEQKRLLIAQLVEMEELREENQRLRSQRTQGLTIQTV